MAVGRKKIVFEQQLNAVTLSISHESWDRMVELEKHKTGGIIRLVKYKVKKEPKYDLEGSTVALRVGKETI